MHGRGPDRVDTLEGRLAGPQGTHLIDLGVHPLPASLEARADGAVVVLPAADPHADGQPATGQHVDGGEVLRDLHGGVGGEDDDGRPEPHPLRQGRRCGELHVSAWLV